MKAIEKPREWCQSKKGHCDALINDIVLLGNKGDGENKEDRSQQEEKFINDLENLKGYVNRLEDQVNLPRKLEGAITVLEMVAHWGLENNDNIIQVIKNIKNSLEEQARGAKEEDINPSLELLEKQVIRKNTISMINFKQIKSILRTKVNGQTNNENELSISLEKDRISVFENKDLRCLIAEFLDDVRDKLRFLFSLSKSLAKDSKITGNLNIYPYGDVITSRVFKELMNKTLSLKEVSLYTCDQLVNNDIEALVKQHTSVTSLDLNRCEKITDAGLKALAPFLGNLTSLDLSDCKKITDEGLELLAPHLGNLTSLNLHGCEKITNKGLEELAPKLGNLTHLDLAWAKITDEGLKALAKNCPNLTHLDLVYCKQITDKGLRVLSENCKSLTSLNLFGCEKITDKGLIALAKNCKNLTSLDLIGCEKITDETLKMVVQGCPKLRGLKDKNGNEPLNRIKAEIEQEGTGLALSQ